MAVTGAGEVFAGPLAVAWRLTPDVLADLLIGPYEGLAVRPARERQAWTDIAFGVLRPLADVAAAERGSPWPQPLASHYARYFRDGNRTQHEDAVRARQHRLTRAVVMACRTGDSGWLDEVMDGVLLLCEQDSWAWVAHDDVFQRLGHMVPDPSQPYLDLGAGEVAAQLAWIDWLLGPELDAHAPGVRQRLRSETHIRVIDPFLQRMDWHWLGLHGDVHNWNPWIHSNLLATALFLVDDTGERARVVARCVEGIDRFLAALPADGAVDEGFAYWWNGAGRALEALRLLQEATGGVLDTDLPLLRNVLSFPVRMHLGGPWHLNFADCPAAASPALPWDLMLHWSQALEADDAADYARALMSAPGSEPDGTSGLGRTLHTLAARGCFPGLPPEIRPEPAAHLPAETYIESLQVLIAREQSGSSSGLTLTVKGGNNGEHHNHLDVGSVTVAVDGVPLLVDAGQPTYTAQTFGPDRYSIRALQSSWHNVPAPFGLEQQTGPGSAATLRAVVLSPGGIPGLELGLGSAYGWEDPDAWIRTAFLDRPAGMVAVSDSWSLPAASPDSPSDDVDIHYLLAGTVSVEADGTALVSPAGIPATPSGRGAVLRWNPSAATADLEEWKLTDPLLAGVWGPRLTRLRFRMPVSARTSGSFTLSVQVAA